MSKVDLDEVPKNSEDLPDGVHEEVFDTIAELNAFCNGLAVADPNAEIVETGESFVRDRKHVIRWQFVDQNLEEEIF